MIIKSTIARLLLTVILLHAFLNESFGYSAIYPEHKPSLRYCIPLPKISLSPYEEFDEPVRLFYLLLLTRSFISTDADEPGILSHWQFSPDGLTFSAKVSPDAKWQDGSRITAREAAYSIAKGITFRPVSERIRVIGTETINQPGWTTRDYPGITVKSNDAFELRFESNVANTAGVVREALSTNARGNRVWAERLTEDKSARPEIASKFPYQWDAQSIVVDAGSAVVSIFSSDDCSASDFKIYGVPREEISQYTPSSSHGQQSLLGIVNPTGNLIDRSTRFALGQWLRQIFSINAFSGFKTLESHFGRLETGYSDSVNWGLSSIAPNITHLHITKGTNYPKNSPVVAAVTEALKEAHIKATLADRNHRPTSSATNEIIIAGARIEGDRQIWMQDHLNDPLFKQIMHLYPKSTAALAEVAKKSSSTIPVGRTTLIALDHALLDEASIIPLARYHVTVFSRSTAPVELIFTSHDELSFKRRQVK